MKTQNQKWLVLAVLLVLIAGTGGAVTWLKGHQKLGQPGIKTAPIPGSSLLKLELPDRVLDFTSTNVPESDVELGYFPRDTSYDRRMYHSPDGFPISGTVILMGADRTSIHRPEYCMVGQGWTILSRTVVDLPIAGPRPYRLPVMKWLVSTIVKGPDGGQREIHGLYVFWFVADGEQTTGNVQLQLYLMRDLLFRGVLQRWAYVSYFAQCEPGQEDAAFGRMKKLIAASAPEFLLPPKELLATRSP